MLEASRLLVGSKDTIFLVESMLRVPVTAVPSLLVTVKFAADTLLGLIALLKVQVMLESTATLAPPSAGLVVTVQ